MTKINPEKLREAIKVADMEVQNLVDRTFPEIMPLLDAAKAYAEIAPLLGELFEVTKHLRPPYNIEAGGIHSEADFIAGKVLGHCQRVRDEHMQFTTKAANTIPKIQKILEGDE